MREKSGLFAAYMGILASLGGSFIPITGEPNQRRHYGRRENATELRAFQFAKTKGRRDASQRSRSNRRKH